MKPLQIFIGYDPRETAAYHVFAQSIIARASAPVSIIPLVQSQLRAAGLYTRPTDERAATQFSLTRFLVPHLAGYEGLALFADCDMLALVDVYELLDTAGALETSSPLGTPMRSLYVCQHDYVPKHAVKMDGQANASYPRKNWSSLMLFDCARCSALTPEYVNRASPAELHRFSWLRDEQIGALPLEWNWLVSEYAPNPNAKMLHFTEGGPWFKETADCDHRLEWLAEWYQIELPVRHAQAHRVTAGAHV